VPVVKGPAALPSRREPGYVEIVCASTEVFDVPVPLRLRRFVVDPGRTADIDAQGAEVMAYVVAGSGEVVAGTERSELQNGSMAWLDPGPFRLSAGDDGL
jgi:quercetin dioxygenase-like cupin family protein